MDRGDLVPDDLVVRMVVERLEEADAANGVLLDGFPRTQQQADALDAELAARGGGVLVALYLDVPQHVLLGRLSGRRVCETCGGTFHVEMHDLPADGSCPTCGRRLIQRRDDQRAAVARRIRAFMDQTMAVLDHYGALRLVYRVRGDRPVDAIRNELLTVLQQKQPTLAAT
jgi:adenylate kinase